MWGLSVCVWSGGQLTQGLWVTHGQKQPLSFIWLHHQTSCSSSLLTSSYSFFSFSFFFFFLRVLCKNLMVGGLAFLNLERFSFLTVTISQILGIAKGFNVLYYSRNSRRLLCFFFLARLLPAVTSASVATFFFSRVFMFGDINNIISYTDVTW